LRRDASAADKLTIPELIPLVLLLAQSLLVELDAPTRSIHRESTQQFEIFKKLRRAKHYAAQWIIGNANWKRSLFADPLVKIS
jgi:hypothetical protein